MEVFLVMVGSDLEVHEHDPWVLHGILDRPKEGDSLTTVDQAVVIREGNVHHRSDHNLAVPDNRSLKNAMHPENCRLRWVDDWSSEQGTEHTAIAASGQ
jgi:hypothetical protein